jgi:uncharacterized protein (DUF697 family)/GTP-binding protein EngB required for normal cell division
MSNYNYDLGKIFEEEYAKVKKSVNKPNILIAGATGVGKSSLINMVFGDSVAVVGTGKPVTQKIDVYENEDVDVRIFDSKGYELVSEIDDEFFLSVVKLADETKNPENAIHLIWYCIAASGGRVTDYDMAALKAFTESEIPVAVVMTKADIASDEDVLAMKSVLPTELKCCVFETTTKMPEYNHLKELVNWSVDKLPDSLRFAFIKSQNADLDIKRINARRYIKQQCAVAFGVGFVPIPISDAPLLVANEMALIARILYLYDLGSVSDMVKSVGLSSVLGSLLTSLGKTAVANLIKLIPGIGTVVGGVISGTVGSTITAAVGEATSVTAYGICKARLNGDYAKADEMIKNFGSILLDAASEWIKQGKSAKDIPEE